MRRFLIKFALFVQEFEKQLTKSNDTQSQTIFQNQT